MPIWTWATNAASGKDPLGIYNFGAWSWLPKDDLGQPLFAPGNYEATVGWKDVSVIGGGETKRILGYSTKLSFDWDGFIFDRIGALFPSTPGRSINRGWSFGSLVGRANTLASMVTGFDGDANLVFANRFDYQYFGSKLNLTRRCDPTEITITNLEKGIIFSYALLFLYFTLTAFSQVSIRLKTKSVAQAGILTIEGFSNGVMQPFLADGVCLGLLKWWDETCIMLTEIKKEYKYLTQKAKRLTESVTQTTVNVGKFAVNQVNLTNDHREACEKALANLAEFATGIYKDQMVVEATTKSATALADFQAKIFSKQKKIPT